MEITYEKALAEAFAVIMKLEFSDIDKIPDNFLNTLKNNMDQEYYATLEIDEEYIDNKLSEDTKGILGLVYRDYLVDETEKETLINNENKSEEEYQEVLREMFNSDLVFKNDKKDEDKDEIKEEVKLIKREELKWYEKLRIKIKKVLGFK